MRWSSSDISCSHNTPIYPVLMDLFLSGGLITSVAIFLPGSKYLTKLHAVQAGRCFFTNRPPLDQDCAPFGWDFSLRQSRQGGLSAGVPPGFRYPQGDAQDGQTSRLRSSRLHRTICEIRPAGWKSQYVKVRECDWVVSMAFVVATGRSRALTSG